MKKKGITSKISKAQKKLSSINDTLNSIQGLLETVNDVKEHLSGVFESVHRLKGDKESIVNCSDDQVSPESDEEIDFGIESDETEFTNTDSDVSSDNIETEAAQTEDNQVDKDDIPVYDLEEDENSHELSSLEPGSFEHSTQKLSNALSDAFKDGLQNPESVAKAVGALVEVASDTIKYVADQTVKQEEIRKQRDVAIAQINATSDLIKTYLEKTFDERKEIFNKQFEAVDAALRTGNTQMLAISLQSINSLAAESPFKNLSDINEVKAALCDENTVWDI